MFIPRAEAAILVKTLGNVVVRGEGTTLILSGEPGLGKSTMVERFLDECDSYHTENILTAVGRCIDMDGLSRGFLPWKEILVELDADRAAGKDQQKKQGFKTMVRTIFDEAGSEWIQNIPHVGDISSAILETAQAISRSESIDPNSGEARELSLKERIGSALKETTGAWLGAIPLVGGLVEAVYKTSQRLTEDRRKVFLKSQEDFFVLVMTRLRELARDNPIVIFLDDLQWGDASSLSLLFYLAKNLFDKPYPLLIIGAYRPVEVHRGRYNTQTREYEPHPFGEKIETLHRYGACREIAVQRFGNEEVKSYIAGRFPKNALTPTFIAELGHATQGNALFLGEMVSNLIDKGILHQGNGIWEQTGEVDYSTLPRTVEGVIRERYERLDDELRELVQIAAVEGEDFSLEILNAILEENQIQLHRKIDSLVNRYGLINRSQKIYDRLTRIYEFTHNLVQKYIYYSMEEDFRRDVHWMIATTLAGYVDRTSPTPGPLATQYLFHLGVGSGIIDERHQLHLPEANGLRNTINPEALEEYLQLTASIATGAKHSYDHDGALQHASEAIAIAGYLGKPSIAIDNLLLKGEVLEMTGRWAGSAEARHEALRRAREGDDAERTGRAATSVGRSCRLQGEGDEAIAILNEALEILEQLGSTPNIGIACAEIGRLYYEQGELDRAADFYNRGHELAVLTGDLLQAANLLGALGIISIDRGDYTTATDYFTQQLGISRNAHDPRTTAYALDRLGVIKYYSGDAQGGVEQITESLRIREEMNYPSGIANSVGNLGIIHQHYHRTDEALACFERTLAIYETLGDRIGIATALGSIGDIQSRLGNHERAMECFKKTMDIFEEFGDRQGIGFALGGIGLVHTRRGEFPEAFECYRRQIEISEEINNPRDVATGAARMADLFNQQQDFAEAIAWSERRLGIGQEIGDAITTAGAAESLGTLYAKTEAFDRAIGYYDIAIEEYRRCNEAEPLARCIKLRELAGEHRTETPNAV